jgi:hypothetical protein
VTLAGAHLPRWRRWTISSVMVLRRILSEIFARQKVFFGLMMPFWFFSQLCLVLAGLILMQFNFKNYAKSLNIKPTKMPYLPPRNQICNRLVDLIDHGTNRLVPALVCLKSYIMVELENSPAAYGCRDRHREGAIPIRAVKFLIHQIRSYVTLKQHAEIPQLFFGNS